jgi:hypothetical protein
MVANIITSAMEMAAIGYNILTGFLLTVAMARRKFAGILCSASVDVLVYIEV